MSAEFWRALLAILLSLIDGTVLCFVGLQRYLRSQEVSRLGAAFRLCCRFPEVPRPNTCRPRRLATDGALLRPRSPMLSLKLSAKPDRDHLHAARCQVAKDIRLLPRRP